MKFFTGSSNKPLAQLIVKELQIPIASIEEHIFPDGERRIRITGNIVDESTVVLQTASTPVDKNYMELFFIVDGLKRSGAKTVTAVVPYFGYQRQDHVFRDGEAVSLEVIIKILQTVGIDKLISFDMHSVRIPDLFTIPVKHVSALPLFAGKIIELLSSTASSAVLVAPDMGGIGRIKEMVRLTNLPFAALEKNRDVVTGDISGDAIKEGSVEGKKIAFIVDDMISSGKTICLAAKVLKSMGIEKIYVFATHAVFSEEASFILQQAPIEKLYVTDTVFIPDGKKFAKLAVLSVAGIIASELQK